MDVEKIKGIVKSLVDSFGLLLYDIEYITQGKRWLLRIYVDKEGGVTLADCENVSTKLSELLDAEDVIPHSYVLEVSSPGLDRPLKRISDYVKYRGMLIKINTIKPYFNKMTFTGRIISAEDEIIRIETEKYGVIDILYSNIANAKLEVEF